MAINASDPERGHWTHVVVVGRRGFLLLMGAIGGCVAALFGGVETLKFMFPNATGEAPLAFKVNVDANSISIRNPLQITDKRVSSFGTTRGCTRCD